MIKCRRTSVLGCDGSSAILSCSSSSQLPAQNVLKTPRHQKTQRYRQAKYANLGRLSPTAAIFLQLSTVAAP
jgi:hypothetical protein